jgi:hypothetical protein
MVHWILRLVGCSHNKCATRYAAIGLMRWTNEGEGQLFNIPSCPKINFILHSAARGEGEELGCILWWEVMTCPGLC